MKVDPDQDVDNPGDENPEEEEDKDDLEDIFFLIPRTILVVYGPYYYDGMLDLRTERLQGIKAYLQKSGKLKVELVPCLDYVNLVRVWFLEELVYECKMTDLDHGGDGDFDPFCKEAAEALERFVDSTLFKLEGHKHPGYYELKRPFCPCFHVNDSEATLKRDEPEPEPKTQDKAVSSGGKTKKGKPKKEK